MAVLLAGRVALVTGAGSGIGRAIAERFAVEGARILALDRYDEGSASLLETLAPGPDGEHRFVIADVRDSGAVEQAVADAAEAVGRIDTLVCSAGVREIGDVYTMEAAEWEHVIAVNLSGTFYCCQAVARRMRETGGGAIVNLSSVGGLIGLAHRPAYTASKHGVVGLTKSLARDLGRDGIRVNAICPGVVRTPLTEQYWADPAFETGLSEVVPVGRSGLVDDVASAAVYLASDLAAYVSGVALTVDGGWLAEKSFVAGPAHGSSFLDPSRTAD